MSNHIISFHVHRKLKGKCHEDLDPYDIEKMCGMFKLILTYFILCIKRWNIIVAIALIHFYMTNKLWRKQIDSVQYINPKNFLYYEFISMNTVGNVESRISRSIYIYIYMFTF